MITLLLACAAGPTLTVTCSDATGAEVFRSECQRKPGRTGIHP